MSESITALVSLKEQLNISKVGIIYSEVKREYFPTEEQYITEKTAKEDAQVIAEEIESLGLTAQIFPGTDKLSEDLKKFKPDMVINLVDSVKGNEYLSSTIPGMLDMMGIPYTGTGLLGLALCFNKFLTRVLLRTSGIPVPNHQLFITPNDYLDTELKFPLISKLNEIHGGVEIDESAISEDEKHLRERLKFLIETYKQPVLVEEFIAGREITVFVIEGANTKVYMAEKVFNMPDEKYKFVQFDDQWKDNSEDRTKWAYTYSRYEDEKLKEMVKKATVLMKMSDYAKFDVRLDQSGRYFFIDSNANPAMGPKRISTPMGFIIEELYAIPFSEIMSRLITNTIVEARSGVKQD